MSNRIKESCFKEAPYQKNLLHKVLHTRKIQTTTTIWHAEPNPDTQAVLTHRSWHSEPLNSVTKGIGLAVAHHVETS
ncbi:MAG: hypothetical protein CMN55_00070 [Sneathiella sp.]|jgi:hypothetical protein|nr:hypothetical protein [Sneathiella sp.]